MFDGTFGASCDAALESCRTFIKHDLLGSSESWGTDFMGHKPMPVFIQLASASWCSTEIEMGASQAPHLYQQKLLLPHILFPHEK